MVAAAASSSRIQAKLPPPSPTLAARRLRLYCATRIVTFVIVGTIVVGVRRRAVVYAELELSVNEGIELAVDHAADDLLDAPVQRLEPAADLLRDDLPDESRRLASELRLARRFIRAGGETAAGRLARPGRARTRRARPLATRRCRQSRPHVYRAAGRESLGRCRVREQN